jgi:hypothetical protein
MKGYCLQCSSVDGEVMPEMLGDDAGRLRNGSTTAEFQ